MQTRSDPEKEAKDAKVTEKATKEAECSNTKDPERALMDCLVRGTLTKDACKAAAVIDTAVKSGKTTDEAVGSDFANMFKDIEREFDQQKAAKGLTDETTKCKTQGGKDASGKILRKKCFDETLKKTATDAKDAAT